MFAEIQSDESTGNTKGDDLGSVSTCVSTIGNMSWGSKTKNRVKRKGGKQQQAEGTATNGRASVIAVACSIVLLGVVAGSALAYLGFRAVMSGRTEDFGKSSRSMTSNTLYLTILSCSTFMALSHSSLSMVARARCLCYGGEDRRFVRRIRRHCFSDPREISPPAPIQRIGLRE